MTHVTGPGGLEAVGRSQEIAEKSIAIAAPICIGSLRAPLLGSALLCITVLQFCTNSIKFAILDCHWAFARCHKQRQCHQQSVIYSADE